MAWTKAAWADVIGTDASKSTVGAAASTTGNFDCNGSNPFIMAAVKVVVIFGSSPDGNLKVEIFGLDADGANEVDTLSMFLAHIPYVTSSEERATYHINVAALDQIQVKVTNLDTTDNVSVWVSAMGAYQ